MRDEKLIGLGVFIAWTFILILTTTTIGYNGLYGQDSYEYLRYCIRIFDFINSGIPPGNYFWPVNYPLMGALLAFITGPQIALQLISIISAAWIVYLICMFLFREFPGREREVILYVMLFLGLSPYFFRYTISSMSDIPAVAFACTAFYGLYMGYKQHHTTWLYAAGFFASMAVFTRFAFLPLLAPALLFNGYLIVKKFRPLLFFAAIASWAIPLLVYLFFKQTDSTYIFHHYLITDWSIWNWFKNSFSTIDGNSFYTLPNIVFVLSFLVHPGYLFPGIVFLYFFIRKHPQPSLFYPVMAFGIALYLLFIAGIPSRNIRYLIPVMPFYLIMCFPGFLSASSWFYERKTMRVLAMSGMVLIQLVLAATAFLPFYKFNRLDKSIAEKTINYHPAVLYTFGIDGALRSYGYHGKIINLWDAPLDSVTKGAMLLFNKHKNEQQWKGKNPMLNYAFILEKGKVLKIKKFESGWELYEIKETYPDTYSGISTERE